MLKDVKSTGELNAVLRKGVNHADEFGMLFFIQIECKEFGFWT